MAENRWEPWDDSLKEEDDVKRLAVNDLHNELLVASVEIGGICDMAYWASEGMAARAHNTGKRLHDITIGELMGMLKAQEEMHAGVERMALGNDLFPLVGEDLYPDQEAGS